MWNSHNLPPWLVPVLLENAEGAGSSRLFVGEAELTSCPGGSVVEVLVTRLSRTSKHQGDSSWGGAESTAHLYYPGAWG